MSIATLYRWGDGQLVPVDYCDPSEHTIVAADSFLVSEGRAFGLGLHEERFLAAVSRPSLRTRPTMEDARAMWNWALSLIPPEDQWFPRCELRVTPDSAHLAFRLRSAPRLTRAVVLATHSGPDPRTEPEIKGPDLEALVAVRTRAQNAGADDAVFLTQNGQVVDGATNAIVWWRGEALCAPPLQEDFAEFARVDSITAKSLFTLAAAMGYETRRESVEPSDLDGCEVWALNALHGIRMVTSWLGGPQLAEKPGRIGAWRDRRDALRAPIGDHIQ